MHKHPYLHVCDMAYTGKTHRKASETSTRPFLGSIIAQAERVVAKDPQES